MKQSRHRHAWPSLFYLGSIALVLLLSVLVMAACSKKEQTAEKKPAAQAEKQHEGHREGVVVLTPDAVKTAGIEVQRVVASTPSEVIGATAMLELNGDRVARINPRVTGRCVSVNASLGTRVQSGQILARIDSGESDQAWSEHLKARARLELANRSVTREEALFAKKVSPEKDLLKARQEQGEAEADMLLAREKFRRLGIDVRQVEANSSGAAYDRPLIPVTSALSGVVVEKTVTQGEMVGPEKTIFTVADLSSLWLMIDIYERDICRVKTGMQIKVSVSAYPGKEFRGRISYLGDIMDEKSRTIKARVTIDNREGLLKPGMFAAASISSAREAEAPKVILVPEEAVFLDGSEKFVFIREGDGKFAVREVLTGPASGGKIEIKEGLKEGDTAVTKGTFALKSELKKKMLDVDEH